MTVQPGGTPDPAAPDPRRRVWPALKRRLRAAREIYEGIYVAPYRSAIHRAYLQERDLFLLLGFADLLGVPNPVAFYTLELYPDLIEQFHEWHLRMGMPQAPEGGFRCC
jgi:hypothetical protein